MAQSPRRTRRNLSDRADPAPVASAFVQARSAPRRYVPAVGDAACAQLLSRAFDLLAGHGVAVIHETAQTAMLSAGATPGGEADRIRLPCPLVEEALAATPKQVTLAGKTAARDIPLPRADKGFIMRTGTGAHGFIDPETRAYRNLDISDVPTIAAVANGLDQVGFIAHPFSYGVHELTSDIHGVASLICHTDKHIWLQPYNVENVEYLMRIVEAAGGSASRPIASTIMCSFTPLEFKVMDIEALIQSGRAGLPVHACSLPSAGGTAPLSVAGNALMALAEILAMVTLGHVLAPGLPIIATPLMFTLDMATGRALHACPESIQAKTLVVQALRGLDLVTHTYGAGSDTPDADRQSMAERMALGQAVALAGTDILGGVGQLETATVFCPVQAALDDEMGAYLRHLLPEPDVSDAALNWAGATEVALGGHFLDSPHTLAGCRDQYRPTVYQRDGRDDYDKSGGRGAWEEARDRVRRLIAAAPPKGLPDEATRAEIARIAARADEAIIGAAQQVHGKREVI